MTTFPTTIFSSQFLTNNFTSIFAACDLSLSPKGHYPLAITSAEKCVISFSMGIVIHETPQPSNSHTYPSRHRYIECTAVNSGQNGKKTSTEQHYVFTLRIYCKSRHCLPLKKVFSPNAFCLLLYFNYFLGSGVQMIGTTTLLREKVYVNPALAWP